MITINGYGPNNYPSIKGKRAQAYNPGIKPVNMVNQADAYNPGIAPVNMVNQADAYNPGIAPVYNSVTPAAAGANTDPFGWAYNSASPASAGPNTDPFGWAYNSTTPAAAGPNTDPFGLAYNQSVATASPPMLQELGYGLTPYERWSVQDSEERGAYEEKTPVQGADGSWTFPEGIPYGLGQYANASGAVPDWSVQGYNKNMEDWAAMKAQEGDLMSWLGPALMAGGIGGLAFSGAGVVGGAEGAAGAAGAAGGLPESYWSMLAEGGGAASDAAATGAGTVGGGGSSLPSWASNYINSIGTPEWFAQQAASTGASQLAGSGGNAAFDSLGNWGGQETALGDLIGNSGVTDWAGNGSSSTLAQIAKALGPNLMSSLGTAGIQGLMSLLAANTQSGAAKDANSTILSMYNQNRADQAPWREAGIGALGRMTNMTTPGNQFTAMQADPGYQFRFDEGQKALDNRLRAAGKFYSGAALKGGQEYAQNFASNEFGNVYNRNASLAGLGQTATNQTTALGANAGNSVAGNILGGGNARASGYAGVGNAAIGGLNAYNSANQYDQLLALLPQLTGR